MESMEILKWHNTYLLNKENYSSVCNYVVSIIDNSIKAQSIKCDVVSRVKSWDSIIQKTHKKSFSNPFVEIEDFCGVRCISIFLDDLEKIEKIIEKNFHVIEKTDKTIGLGKDKMGYQSKHYIVKVNSEFISDQKCEIQIRTSLQNAWADLSHTLVYKNSEDDKYNIERKINNISAALEVIQDQVDSIRRGMQKEFSDVPAREISKNNLAILLPKDIKSGYLARYCAIKFSKYIKPKVSMDMVLLNKAIADLPDKYKTIGDIDKVVDLSLPFVLNYAKENPVVFPNYVDYLTKCLLHEDEEFLRRHGAAKKTRESIITYKMKIYSGLDGGVKK